MEHDRLTELLKESAVAHAELARLAVKYAQTLNDGITEITEALTDGRQFDIPPSGSTVRIGRGPDIDRDNAA